MPLVLPSEVITMIQSTGCEAETTLDIQLGGSSPIHLSTANINDIETATFGTVDYQDSLRVAASLGQTITTSVDRVDLTVQNIDLVLGSAIINNPAALNGALGILSVVFISGGTKKQVTILRGQVSNASSESSDVKLQLVSYLSLSGPVGGWRPLMLHCALRYKRTGCDSTDPSPTCSHLFEDSNGCSAKQPAPQLTTPVPLNNQGRFEGFVYRSPVIVGSGISDPQGAIDGGNDFNTYNRTNNWEGRHVLPTTFYGV